MSEDPVARARADEAVAARFTRFMDAAVSPRGIYTDITLASAFSAVPVVLLAREAASGELGTVTALVLLALVLAPVGGALLVSLTLRDGRERVVTWLAAQPFPIENLNSLLVGLGDGFEVVFEREPLPTREVLQPRLDAISEDAMYLGEFPDDNAIEMRVGVYDSKTVPARTHFLRYERFRRIVEEVLVPLHREHPIRQVRIS